MISERVAWREDDGDVLIVTPDDAMVTTLTKVASFAFSCFDGKRDLSSVVASIVETFEVTEEAATSDLLAFVDDLHARGIIEWRK